MRPETKNILFMALLFSAALIISILNPFGGNALTDEMKIMFSFVGVLFSILSGFFIASLWSRFTRVRTLISSETASLENIYKFFELVDKKMANEVAKKIDTYIIKALEFDLHEYQEKIREEYFALYEPLKVLKGKKMAVPFTRILSIFDHFTKSRKEILSRGRDRIGIFHWAVLFLLASMLIALWLYIQFAGIFGLAIGTVFIFALLVVLTIVYDLNDLNWGSEQINVEVYERVYDVMGMPRYYPEELLDKMTVPEDIKEYRVGILVDPKTYKRKIKKVKKS